MAKKEEKSRKISVRLDFEAAKKLDAATAEGYTVSQYVNKLLKAPSADAAVNVEAMRSIIVSINSLQSLLEFEEDQERKKIYERGVKQNMSCLKIVPESYLNHDAIEILIHRYIYPKAQLIGGVSVDPLHAAEQMHLVKDLWFQNYGRQLRHFILAFSDKECDHINSPGSLEIGAYQVCDYYADEYQIVFGIHQNKNGWHIHFVMNNVNFVTGKRYRDCKMNDWDLKCHIVTSVFPIQYIDVVYD